jgi:hypothetical protein
MDDVISNTVLRYRLIDLNRWIWHADKDIQLTVLCGEGDLTRESMTMRAKWVEERDKLIYGDN